MLAPGASPQTLFYSLNLSIELVVGSCSLTWACTAQTLASMHIDTRQTHNEMRSVVSEMTSGRESGLNTTERRKAAAVRKYASIQYGTKHISTNQIARY